jgi:radical SAM superfamily enzyme YgiQ (UPF0313 family)
MSEDLVSIALVQINNSFSGQSYLPYSAACLQSYVQAHAKKASRYQFLEPIYKRGPIREIVERLKKAHIVGFSTYVWNIQISLETARRLKKNNPAVKIIFGGPEVPDLPEEFLRKNPFIDVAFHNESEKSFLSYIEQFPVISLEKIAGVSWIDDSDHFHQNPKGERIRDLDEIPSPFLNGIFDELIRNHPEESWIGLWETNRGCPFQCSYCDWGSATAAKVTKFGEERLFLEADWFSEQKIDYVFVCDANFGMLARDIDLAQRVADNRQRTGYPKGFSVQNTKNATERAYITQKILSDYGLNKGVALSIQTLSKEALKNIRRDNISLEVYLELQSRFSKDKVETYSDLILGLPGETYESYIEGINQLLISGQHNRIQFNNCAILPNAEMANPDYRLKYEIETTKTSIVNIHGHREILEDDVEEQQELIVSTYSLSREDWQKCRAISWMSALLHFDKILQIPIIVLHEVGAISYRDIFESFMQVKKSDYPLLASIRDFFIAEAANIQKGGYEYTYSADWLGIFWPADEYIFIKITVEKTLEQFYAESGALLKSLIPKKSYHPDIVLALDDALKLNYNLLNQPFVFEDREVSLSYNVMEFYQGVICGEAISLDYLPSTIRINASRKPYSNLQDWCREIVWWGNKKGAYLYGNHAVTVELAGHY